MSEYKPTPGERAVLLAPSVGGVSVMVADSLPKFDSVGEWDAHGPGLYYRPIIRKGSAVVVLDRDTQDWAWKVLIEAKRLSEAGEDLSVLATHHLVQGTGRRKGFVHIAPIHPATDEAQLPIGDLT